MGYTNSIIETYETLIGKKQKYYVPNVKLSPEEIINLIDQSWKGTDATNFKTNIESDTNELNDEIIYLNSWSSYLSKASDGYDDTLHKYLSKIQELNSDFSDYKM